MCLADCNVVWHGLHTLTGFSIRSLDISDSYLLHLMEIIKLIRNEEEKINKSFSNYFEQNNCPQLRQWCRLSYNENRTSHKLHCSAPSSLSQ